MEFNIWARQENTGRPSYCQETLAVTTPHCGRSDFSVLLDNFQSVSTRDDGNRPLNIERRPLPRPSRTKYFREYGPIPLLSDISGTYY